MRILIALDRSDRAENVVDVVSKRTWSSSTIFYLISVVETHNGHTAKECNDFGNTCAAELQVHRLAMRLKTRFPANQVFTEVLHGAPVEQLVTKAQELNVDLIVLGHQGTSTHSPRALGGVAEAVVQKAHCSVEIIKSPCESDNTNLLTNAVPDSNQQDFRC